MLKEVSPGHGHVETGEAAEATPVCWACQVAHDETLEAELILEDVVQELGVLAAVRVVDLVVAGT